MDRQNLTFHAYRLFNEEETQQFQTAVWILDHCGVEDPHENLWRLLELDFHGIKQKLEQEHVDFILQLSSGYHSTKQAIIIDLQARGYHQCKKEHDAMCNICMMVETPELLFTIEGCSFHEFCLECAEKLKAQGIQICPVCKRKLTI